MYKSTRFVQIIYRLIGVFTFVCWYHTFVLTLLFFVMIGIYEIKNILNDKRYIGQSRQLERRLLTHRNLLNKNKHFNRHLQSAWHEYGAQNFEFNIIETCDKMNLNDRETYWKLFYDPNTYNLGNTGNVHTVSVETREKISKTINNYMKSLTAEERKQKFGHKKNVGKKLNEETKARISNTLKGRPSYIRSDYTRRLVSEKNNKRRYIFQYDREGNFIKAWHSIADCLKHYPQLDQGAISRVCRLNQTITKGFIFRYTSLEEIKMLELGYIPILNKTSY